MCNRQFSGKKHTPYVFIVDGEIENDESDYLDQDTGMPLTDRQCFYHRFTTINVKSNSSQLENWALKS